MKLAKSTTFGLLALLIVGAALRLAELATWYPVGDEAFHVSIVLASFPDEFLSMLGVDSHPPLFYLFEKIPVALLSELNLTVVRIIPLILGIAAIPASFYLGNMIAGAWAGLFLAALACFSVVLVDASQVVRHYTLLFVIQTVLLILLLRQRYSLKDFAIFSLIAFSTLMTHYLAIFFVGILSVLYLKDWLKNPDSISKTKKIALWSGSAFVSLTAWSTGFWHSMIVRSKFQHYGDLEFRSLQDVLNHLYLAQTELFYSEQTFFPYLMGALILVGVAALLSQKEFGKVSIAVVPIILSLLLIFFDRAQLTPDRRLSFLLPGAFLAIAYAFKYLEGSPRALPQVILFLLLGINILSAEPNVFQSERPKQDSRITTAEFKTILQTLQAGDHTIYTGSWLRHALQMEYMFEEKINSENGKRLRSLWDKTVFCPMRNRWQRLEGCFKNGDTQEAWLFIEPLKEADVAPLKSPGETVELENFVVMIQESHQFTKTQLYRITFQQNKKFGWKLHPEYSRVARKDVSFQQQEPK